MSDTNDDTNDSKNLNESVDKIRLNTQVKRGSETRNEDRHDLKVRGETAEEAADRLDRAFDELVERGFFEKVRNVQPVISDGGEDGEDDD